ncbi:MAG: hypothetical protein LH472_07385 [Pyrinomonadaceae bacterium]|nr:hypothetical protein [Pyrinomonadaceae bacterium]
MDLINELGNELALTFLVERKFKEKIENSDVPTLIGKIKDVLQPLSVEEPAEFHRVKPLKNRQH